MKTLRNIFLLAFGIFSVNSIAATWANLVTTDNGVYHFDSSSVTGPLSNRKITIRVNFLKERPDKFKSMLTSYSIDCPNNIALREVMKGYTEPNLGGSEVNFQMDLQKREEIKPNSIVKNYADIACGSNKAAAPAAGTATSNNSAQGTPQNRFKYFSRVNAEKNLQEAFASLSAEQKEGILWNFLFANNVYIRLTKGNSWQNQISVLSPMLPTMKAGVERYQKSFEEIANALGVPRAAVMEALDIEFNEIGYASFRQYSRDSSQKNGNLNGATNVYILVYGASTRQERDHYGRDMNPYYRERPPAYLYTTAVTEDLKQIEGIQQKVIATASRIEAQLVAKENDRIKAEKDAAMRREADEKRLAEERIRRQEEERKRQEFLNSPEGKKQRAREEQEEKQRQRQFNQEFPFYAVITCGEHFPVHACFAGRVNTELEIRNGGEYKMYSLVDIMQIPQNQNGISFNLRNKFEVKMQNSSDSLILNLKIYNRASNSIVFEKSAARFGVIRASN